MPILSSNHNDKKSSSEKEGDWPKAENADSNHLSITTTDRTINQRLFGK